MNGCDKCRRCRASAGQARIDDISSIIFQACVSDALRASSGHVRDHRRGIGQVGAKIAVAGVYGVRASVRW
jgi:hypothetical protein